LLSYDEVTRDWSPAFLEYLTEAGWLREAEPATSLQLLDCPGHCIVEPDWTTDSATGQTVGLYFCHEPDCGCQEIDPQRMRQWEPSFAGLACMIQAACGIQIPPVMEVPERLCWLGALTAHGAYRDLFLARGLRWSDGLRVIERTQRLRSSPSPAIVALSRLPTLEFWRGLSVQPPIIALSECLRAERGFLAFDLSGLFAQRVQPHGVIADEQWLTVQQAAALHVADVDELDLGKAKARISAAASRGKFQTNGAKGPARRIEPTSFAKWRLLQRDRNLNRAWD
jgi:hypothetical protein